MPVANIRHNQDNRKRDNWLWIRLSTVGLAAAGLLVTLVFTGVASQSEHAEDAHTFDRTAQAAVDAVARTVAGHLVVLEATRSFVAACDTLDQARFAMFAAPLLHVEPGMQALEWAPLVEGEHLAGFEAAAAADFPGYRVVRTGPDGALEPVIPGRMHAPVRLLYPIAGNAKATGYDLASSEVRRQAIRRSLETGLPAATAPITLVQETGTQAAYLVFVPVEDRGCVLGVFRAGDVLGLALDDVGDIPLDILVRDEDATDQPLYARGAAPRYGGGAVAVTTMDMAGRRWRVEIAPRGNRRALLPPLALLVLLGGLAVTGFAVVVLQVLARQYASVAEAVVRRTDELRASEDRLRTVVDLSSDLVYWRSPDGALLYVSPAAAAVTGHAAETLAARPELLTEMVHPADRDAWKAHERRVLAGENCDLPEFRIVTADGQERWVRHRCRPIRDAQGRNLGLRASDTDVTAAKLASLDLQRERHLFAGGPVAVFRLRLEAGWPVEYASPNAAQVCGDALDDLLAGRIDFTELVHAGDRPRVVAETTDQVRAGRRSFEVEFRVDAPGLPLRTYRAYAVPVVGQGDRVTHLDGYLLDTTDAVAARSALAEASERLKLALAGSDLGLWDWTIETGEVVFDERWCAMLGYRPGELAPSVDTWKGLLHPDDARRVMADVQRHLDGESDHYETEHRLRHRDGSWIWVLDRGRVIARDAAGRPLRAAGTHQDITARRREELRSRRAAAVREEAAVRLAHGSDEDAIQAAARAILADVGGMMGADGGVLLSHDPASGWCEPIHAWHDPAAGPRRPWTAGALAVLGAWREIEPGGVRASLALGADDPRPEGPLGELLAQRGSHALLLHSVRLGDDLAYVLAFEAGRAMRHWSEGDGETLRSVLESLGYAFERLHLHRAHEATRKQLETALQRAEQANLVKSTFLARMSHEIRTPLTAIVGFADILERGRERLGERDLYWVGQIRSNADHLVALLNDLLDISKIEAKELRVVREAVDVRAAIDTVATSMRVKAADKMLDFRVEIMPDVPLAIVSDGLRLRQILVNLVGNAVKFTERGSVEVAVRHEPAAGDGTGDLVIAVRDTGIGIADDQLEAVFQPFQQAAGLDHARFGGTGLGLDISRRLARMLGGDLTVVSGLGAGSTFTVRLPAEPAAPPAAAAQAAAPAAACAAVDGARVLLADDSPDNRTIVSFYLEEAGIVPECVADGAEAVAAVHAAQAAGRPYDLILMDMRMPVMDGYEATRTLRAQGVRTPIVALTAHAMAGDSEACLAFGCHGYLAKPIEPQGLIQTVASFLPQGRIPAAAPRRLRSRMADEPRFAVHLERYLGTLATIAEQLRTALADGDALQVESLAHRLHGTGASFGYPDISRVAADAEESLRAGADLEDVRGGIEELVELAEAARRGAPEPAGVPAT